MQKRWIRTAATGVACLGAVAVTASPAQAAEPHHWMYTNDSGANGARVDFWPRGDEVKLCDKQSDGARADLKIWNVTKDPDQVEYDLQASGDEVCATRGEVLEQPFNLAEGDCFRFRIRLLNNGNEVDGSRDIAQWRNHNNSTENCDRVD
ncbi:hypothetical protein ACQEU8_19805 [Streptomyces sp. CA-250714]|uniref:hypothetical protein n=1 Tax=Streptomyces sp. CA-250714 TaxID=3240060 RepID=UPI003D94C2B1